jgi:Ca2+-binding EF-hand superfamily protein
MPAAKGPGRPVPVQIEPTVKRLTKKDLKVSDAMFAALDQDGDDELDMEELCRFGQNVQPEIEIAIHLGKLEKDAKPASVIKAGTSPLKVFASPANTEIAIEVPGVRLDLMAPQVINARNAASMFRTGYLNRFRNTDRDGNGYIDMNESNFDPIFRELFAYLDRDGDGKIFEKELIAALDEVEEIVIAASTGISSIELNENGRGLFGAIDINSDGKLSIPELRAMPKLVERFAANKDLGLAPADVPRRFEASFSNGISMIRQTFAPVPRIDGMTGQPRAPMGPLWFQKMDRNRDGYVSRREFLGTDEEFRKLDLDGDGFISLEEAEVVGKK